MKWLVIETEYFFDGHGTPDSGAINKFITDKRIYSYIKSGEYYYSYEFRYFDNKQLDKMSEEEIVENVNELKCKDLYEQDGYNCTASTYKVIKVSDVEAEMLQLIIEQYNKLEDLVKIN